MIANNCNIKPINFGNTNNKKSDKEQNDNEFSLSSLLVGTLLGLSALGSIFAKSKTPPVNIKDISFVKDKFGRSFAYKGGKLFSGVVEITKNNTLTKINFLDGLIQKSVKKQQVAI